MDIGSAVGRDLGITEEQLRDLPAYKASTLFSPLEKLVIEYAERMTTTPVTVSDELFGALKQHLNEAQLVELTGIIAWESRRRISQRVRTACCPPKPKQLDLKQGSSRLRRAKLGRRLLPGQIFRGLVAQSAQAFIQRVGALQERQDRRPALLDPAARLYQANVGSETFHRAIERVDSALAAPGGGVNFGEIQMQLQLFPF